MDCPKLNKVCFISGAPHSGSTLLGLILGSHSKSFYAGEANKTRFIGNDKINGPNEDKACKIMLIRLLKNGKDILKRQIDFMILLKVKKLKSIMKN
ncbi:MAG: hypothetical protein P8Y97_15725 [Candidatus Lokiarchaeota archaeon]